ncbi:N-acetylmuramate 1-kinase [Burkholderiales bacterium]|nr:N-acetylmuramate 1-kinase [Burkholderiales bacterium]
MPRHPGDRVRPAFSYPRGTGGSLRTMTVPDPRLDALAAWLRPALAGTDFLLAPASADASFRRYFRVSLDRDVNGERTLIAMDAPPPMEDCRPFVHVAALLRGAGVHAPRVLAQDLDRGFLLLTDLGTTTYLDAIGGKHPPGRPGGANPDGERPQGRIGEASSARAHALYVDAIDALVRWQSASREGELPPYDEALLRRELELFPDWYVAKHLGISIGPSMRDTLERTFALVLENNLAQPRAYVHRDYHSRNLMVSDPNPGVIDFQDAVHGPITYDLVSLLRDAYVAWDEERQIDWAVRFWERARKARLPVDADFSAFWRDFEWMGVQRQLKVLGIFARLAHRDGKDGYLADMPRVMGYLRGACGRYSALGPLARLLDALEGRAPATGLTF